VNGIRVAGSNHGFLPATICSNRSVLLSREEQFLMRLVASIPGTLGIFDIHDDCVGLQIPCQRYCLFSVRCFPGHQRLVAARKLGLRAVPVIFLDLTEEKATLLNIALNKISGEFDEELRGQLLVGLADSSDLDLSLS
jgi:hypothetical protein